tara:strand:- start:283 stop:1125 length:843 start_codon:yes stop_codon:yes gene_type:complete
MKLLRETIRKLLIEVYELDDEQLAQRKAIQKNHGDWLGSFLARSTGLQSAEDQRKDRSALQRYQKNLDTPEGKKLRQAFMRGDVTILHSMGYKGASHRASLGGTDNTSLASSWIKKYGKQGNDALSTVAFPEPNNSTLAVGKNLGENGDSVVYSRGLILKGFPIYLSEYDVFSQTLGAVDHKMKAHWKNSGMPKRPMSKDLDFEDLEGELPGITSLQQLQSIGYSEEVLLDNWTVIGTYISKYDYAKDKEVFIQDSLAMGLPCNVYDSRGRLLKRHAVGK